MKKCKQCGQKKGVHKMSCESKKQFLITPKFENKEDIKHWGVGEENIFIMLNNIVNGKNNS
jgi:hypothetical protein